MENIKQIKVNEELHDIEDTQARQDILDLTQKTSKLKEDLVANEKEDAKTKRSLSALWDLNNGISYRFETDSEKSYKKQIPSGAKLSSVNKVGGKTIVMNQLIDPSKRDAEKIEFNELTKHFKYDNWSDIGSIYICRNINLIKGHKYYIYATDKVRYTIMYFYGEGMKETLSKDTDAETVIKKVLIATDSGINNLYFNRYTVTSENVSYFDGSINLIDLTKMFGSGNEPTTPEEFEAMLPNDYYPYNEGELMSMSVNDVDVVGKNIFESKGFSSSSISDDTSFMLSNDYGTSINSTEPSNRVTVTQSKIGQEDINISYLNGYFCIVFKPVILNKEYVFSFDVIPSNKLISNPKIIVLMNGGESINVEYTQDLQIGKRCKLYFKLKVNSKELRYIELRNSGISGIFENFQIEEGSINTSYSPYTKKSYSIPQSIQNLDGYGWSAGTTYNYVDFENKKFHKCVDRINLDNYTWKAYQRDNSPFYYSEFKINELKPTFNVLSLTGVRNIEHTPSNTRLIYANGTILNETNKPRGYLYFELAEPIVTDISDIIGDIFQEPFDVESGGSLTFKNTNGDGYRIAVPSDIQYVVALSEVNV